MKKEKLKTDMLIARRYDCDFQSDLVNCLEWIYTSTGTTNVQSKFSNKNHIRVKKLDIDFVHLQVKINPQNFRN